MQCCLGTGIDKARLFRAGDAVANLLRKLRMINRLQRVAHAELDSLLKRRLDRGMSIAQKSGSVSIAHVDILVAVQIIQSVAFRMRGVKRKADPLVVSGGRINASGDHPPRPLELLQCFLVNHGHFILLSRFPFPGRHGLPVAKGPFIFKKTRLKPFHRTQKVLIVLQPVYLS